MTNKRNTNRTVLIDDHIEEYTGNSTIHGMRYLGERRRPLAEKVWWIIVFTISITFCVIYIRQVFMKWKNEPVIVSFAEKPSSVRDIPFPAVTICSENKSLRTIFNYSKAIEDINFSMKNPNMTKLYTEEDINHIESLSHVCSNTHYDVPGNDTDWKLMGFKEFSSEDNVEDLYHIGQIINKTIFGEIFDSQSRHEFKLFTENIASQGLCFSFNLMKSSQIFKEVAVQYDFKFLEDSNSTQKLWTIDEGYSKKMIEKDFFSTYPFRPSRTGRGGGLELFLAMNEIDVDIDCRLLSMPGFKVVLHSPADFPVFGKHEFSVNLNKEVNVYVRPKKEEISEELKSYSPERRSCYMSKERELKYFREYTKSNCEMECLSNYTFSKCGCVKFSMIRDKSMPICGILKIQCYNDAIREFEYQSLKRDPNHEIAECNCMLGCNYVKYDFTYVETDYDIFKKLVRLKNVTNVKDMGLDYEYDEIEHLKFSFMNIFLVEDDIIPLVRSARYGLVDLISNCGGLLGLFMGVSILSFIEILYYFTLRLCCKLKKQKETNEKSQIKEISDNNGDTHPVDRY